MKEIIYKFNDGSRKVVEVTDDFYEMYMYYERLEMNKQQTETRRHVSIEYLNERGVDIESPDSDPLESIIDNLIKEKRKKDLVKLREAVKELSSEQRKIIYKIFVLKQSQTKIAEEMGIDESSVRERKRWAIKKLKKFLG